MRHILAPLLIWAVLMSVVSSAAGQWDRRNAATWYRKVVEASGWEYETNSTYPDSVRLLTSEERDLLNAYREDPSGGPSPEVRRVLAKAAPMMEWLHRGSQQRYSDFQLDYSQGFSLLLPHLAPLRNAARVMHADALARLHDGDVNGAVDRIASVYRMSGHVGNDRIIISSLVGGAVFDIADAATQTGLDQTALSPFDSAVLLNALKRLEPVDPFGMIESVAMEQAVAVDWLSAELGTEEQRSRYLQEEGWLVGEEGDRAILEMTDEEFAAELDGYDRMMDRVVEAFANPDREAGRAALERIAEECSGGEFGVLASLITPTFSGILDHIEQSEQKLKARTEQLEKLASGEVKPEEEANAAIYYEQGIELLRKIDLDRLDAACAFGAGESEQPDEAIIETLDSGRPVVDLFREGSLKRRCDFGFLRPGRQAHLCPPYLAGMHDALRFIIADARRLMAAGQIDAAVDRLAICCRVVAHLTGDEPLLSAPVGHGAFKHVHELVQILVKSPEFTDEKRGPLIAAAESIVRKDPFGYISSVTATREKLTWQLQRRSWTLSESEREALEKAVAYLGQLSGDQLLYILVLKDTLAAAETGVGGEKAPTGPHPLTRMDGIISFEALVEARDQAEAVAPLLADHQLERICRERKIPDIARFAQRRGAARADLRRMLTLLRPPRRPRLPEPADPGAATGDS
ncbi:MAG: hypothetical protein JSV91_01910 [Phycisphaerales bacterium]|nr:MAG: hypothetical protein JSV91_01910 [Phycisphaerales bacterium]